MLLSLLHERTQAVAYCVARNLGSTSNLQQYLLHQRPLIEIQLLQLQSGLINLPPSRMTSIPSLGPVECSNPLPDQSLVVARRLAKRLIVDKVVLPR